MRGLVYHQFLYLTLYLGNFGDGTVHPTSEYQVNHAYSAPGTYNVTVTVEDSQGRVNSNSKQVTIIGDAVSVPPVASFTAVPTTINEGESVAFNATGSSDSDGTIVSYTWSFGNGLGTGITTNQTYNTAGVYTAFVNCY